MGGFGISSLRGACLVLTLGLLPPAPVLGAEPAQSPTGSANEEATAAPASTGGGEPAALAAVGGFHAGLAVWAYFAWYRDMPSTAFRIGGDGYFGEGTYAGGADKLGHFWAGSTFSRIGGEVLIHGGWRPLPASLISSGLTLLLLGVVEVKDGYYTEFSPGDLAGNLGGAALSVLLVNVPAADAAIDFRVQYLPSSLFREAVLERGDVDVANDYSGQTYLLAFHLKSVRSLVERQYLGWASFLDLVVGFETRGFLPEPSAADAVATQRLFLGAALNLQHVLEASMGRSGDRPGPGDLAFEFLSIPYTTLPAVGWTRPDR